MILNHTIILNLCILYILPDSLTNSWVLDRSNGLSSDGFALIVVLVVCANQHFLFAADEDFLVVGFEAVLCIFREEVTFFQLEEDFLPWIYLLREVLLRLGEDLLCEGGVKLEVLEVCLRGVELAGVCSRIVVTFAHFVENQKVFQGFFSVGGGDATGVDEIGLVGWVVLGGVQSGAV